MKWLVDESLLDKQQREFLEKFLTENDNEQVKGFPGSGKTVLLVYAVQKIREQNPNARILFIEFTHSLIKMLNAALSELKYEGKDIHPVHVVTYFDFARRSSAENSWDYIVCDEVQDIPTAYLDKMRNAARRVIVGGDANQSIYDVDPKDGLPTCKPRDIRNILNPSDTSLNIIHRIGRKVANAINAILPGMNILSGRPTMNKVNMQIRVWKAKDRSHETKLVLYDAIDAIGVNKSVAILLPTHNKIETFIENALQHLGNLHWEPVTNRYGKPDYNDLNRFLIKNNIAMQIVANGSGDLINKENKIVVTTYHSSKGLDFDKVFLPFCDSYNGYEPDNTLLMVAMTRCREDLIVSYTGQVFSSIARIDEKDMKYQDWTNPGPNLFDTVEKKEEDIFGF